MRRARVPEEKIAALQVAILDPALFTEKELTALELADRMTASGQSVSDELWNRLTAHFDEGQIVELVAVIGVFNYFNRFAETLRVEITT